MGTNLNVAHSPNVGNVLNPNQFSPTVDTNEIQKMAKKLKNESVYIWKHNSVFLVQVAINHCIVVILI